MSVRAVGTSVVTWSRVGQEMQRRIVGHDTTELALVNRVHGIDVILGSMS